MINGHYLRFVALGDSTTFGIGDPVVGGWRGWARLLADSLATSYDVSFCNVSVSGATAATLRRDQLANALAHRPQLASVMVGINDTFKSTWDPGQVREDLMATCGALVDGGAVLMTPRFHDHAEIFGLPGFLARPLARRIEALNRVWDDVHAVYGGLRVDTGEYPEIRDKALWAADRMHPSERGHRMLARVWGEQLVAAGLAFEPTSPEPFGGIPHNWRRDMLWVMAEGAPWVGRRAKDLGPWAAKWAISKGAVVPAREVRQLMAAEPVGPAAPR